MDAEQRTVSYKNLMVRQYDATQALQYCGPCPKKGLISNQKPEPWKTGA